VLKFFRIWKYTFPGPFSGVICQAFAYKGLICVYLGSRFAHKVDASRSDTSFSYYEDVEENHEFISCCGPGEWVVCNCLSERDEFAEPQLSNDDITEPAAPLKIGTDSVLDGFSALATSAIAMHEVFLGFMAAGFTEDQALKIITGLILSD